MENLYVRIVTGVMLLKADLLSTRKTARTQKGLNALIAKEFQSYAAVRIHERRLHESEFRSELEASKPPPETLLMATIAKIEATSKSGG